jgi:hypothetical protein
MTGRQLTILILLAGYVLTTGALTIYHAYNFSVYVHWKGDETIYYTLFLLLTSIFFQGAVWTVVKAIDWKAASLATIVNSALSFIVGFGIFMVSDLEGFPRHLIFIYGACFLTFFTVVTILQANRLKELKS